MSAALPGGGAAAGVKLPPNANPRRLLLIGVVLVIVVVLLFRVFSHHETAYERTAREMTVALQNNDLTTVERFQNAETRSHVTRAVVGHAADVFTPLGKLDKLRQTSGDGQTHEFDATFDKAVVHETFVFDPDGKVVHFKYDPPTPK
jgi:hypothetical protein